MTNANDLARYPAITDNCVTCGKSARGRQELLNRNGQLEHLDCHAWDGDDFFFRLRLETAPVLARDLGQAKEHLERLILFWRRAEQVWPSNANAIVRGSWTRMEQFRKHIERKRLDQALRHF